jgi:hypothetical protein
MVSLGIEPASFRHVAQCPHTVQRPIIKREWKDEQDIQINANTKIKEGNVYRAHNNQPMNWFNHANNDEMSTYRNFDILIFNNQEQEL